MSTLASQGVLSIQFCSAASIAGIKAWLLEQSVKYVICFLCSQADMPLIYANEAFARITGYSVAESLGKNCRFLQVGPRLSSIPTTTVLPYTDRSSQERHKACVLQ